MISHTSTPRGFTLLIAVILSAVILSLGLTLADISYKQVTLAASAKQSQFAFYAADSAMECALYYDQQLVAFDYYTGVASQTLRCGNQTATAVSTVSGSTRTTTFAYPCVNGVSGSVRIQKSSNGHTLIYATGYNTCDTSSPGVVERGLKVTY